MIDRFAMSVATGDRQLQTSPGGQICELKKLAFRTGCASVHHCGSPCPISLRVRLRVALFSPQPNAGIDGTDFVAGLRRNYFNDRNAAATWLGVGSLAIDSIRALAQGVAGKKPLSAFARNDFSRRWVTFWNYQRYALVFSLTSRFSTAVPSGASPTTSSRPPISNNSRT